MASSITFSVNGKAHTVSVVPETPLLYVLRNDLELDGAKFGCGLAQCGACTVIADGAARLRRARGSAISRRCRSG